MTGRRRLSEPARALVRMHRAPSARGLTRRAALAAGAGGAAALLGACGTGSRREPGSTAAPRPSAAADRSDQEKVVRWANWTAYLDYDEDTKKYPTLEAFQEQTGLEVSYAEEIEDNDSYYGKIQGQLRNGQDIGRDVVVFSDYMVARLVRQGYAQPLDRSAIPNAANMLPELRDVDYDPGREFSLTWQSGYTGIAYNKKLVADLGLRITKVSDLWHPKLKGRVEVLSEYHDTIGLIMLEQGVDVSGEFTDAQFQAGLDVLAEQLDRGQIRQVRGNSYLEDLVPVNSPAAIAVIGWSGDILSANVAATDDGAEEEPFEFVLPEPGGLIWSDNLMVPIGSPHKRNAETLMNYYYDPKVAAEVAAWVQYICPVQGAEEAILAIDPELAGSRFIFPTPEDLAQVTTFRTLPPETETRYSEMFQSVLGA